MSNTSSLFSENGFPLISNGISSMIISDEAVQSLSCLMCYGRRNIQELVARSNDIDVTLAYLRFELNFEILNIMSYKTKDSINFEKKRGFIFNLRLNNAQ